MLTQYTYAQLRKAEHREDIKSELFASVGTQSGGFGNYKEHFRTISKEGADVLKRELEYTAGLIGVTYEQFMESMPELKKIIE